MRRLTLRNLAVWATGVPAAFMGLYAYWTASVGDFKPWAAWTCVLLLALGGVVAVSDIVVTQRHHDKTKKLAEMLGWEFDIGAGRYSKMSQRFPFGTGDDVHQQNVIHGWWRGVSCASFTHHFDVPGHGLVSRDEVFQVTLVELPVMMPYVEVVPESWAQRFAKIFGASDINVESEAFNKQWRVIHRDAKYAHAMMHPRTMDRLMRADALNMAIRIEGSTVMAWQPGWQDPSTLAERLSVLIDVARLIPEHLVREHGQPVPGRYRVPITPLPDTAPSWATTPGALTSRQVTDVPVGQVAEPAPLQPTQPHIVFDIFNLMTW